MSIELPPLRPSTYGQATTKSEPQPRTYTAKSVEARERILLARIAELSSAAQEVIDHLPHRHDVNLNRLRAAIDAARKGES